MKRLKHSALICLSSLLLITASGCSGGGNDKKAEATPTTTQTVKANQPKQPNQSKQAQKVSEMTIAQDLGNKYQQTFSCRDAKLSDNNITTAVCNPQGGNASIKFNAMADSNRGSYKELVSDDYVPAYVSKFLKIEIVANLKTQNINVEADPTISGYDMSAVQKIHSTTGYTVKAVNEFIQQFPNSKFSADVIIDGTGNEQQYANAIYNLYTKLASEHPTLDLVTTYRIINHDDYARAVEEMDKYPSVAVNSKFFDSYKVTGQAEVGIKNGQVTTYAGQIAQSFKNGVKTTN